MSTVVIGALAVLGMIQQTDTIIPLDGRQRLSVEAAGGSIAVGVWDRNEVRVQGEHSSRTYVEIQTGRNTIEVESEARRGPANIVDYVITVPRSLSLSLEGQFTDITVEGADGEVEAETVQGDITIRGGRGTVRASSANGLITVEGAQGRVDIESAGSDILIRDVTGEVLAESAGGDVILENVRATSVDAGSVGGRVYYDGTVQAGGTYFFGSHGGSVTIVVAETAAASFNVASVHGSISSNLPGSPERFERGQRHTFDMNGGGALIEVETFGGRIQLLRKGTEGGPPRTGGGRQSGAPAGLGAGFDFDFEFDRDFQFDQDFDFDFGFDFDFDYAFGAMPTIGMAVGQAMAEVEPGIDAAVERALAQVQPQIDLAIQSALDVSETTLRALGEPRPATIRR